MNLIEKMNVKMRIRVINLIILLILSLMVNIYFKIEFHRISILKTKRLLKSNKTIVWFLKYTLRINQTIFKLIQKLAKIIMKPRNNKKITSYNKIIKN